VSSRAVRAVVGRRLNRRGQPPHHHGLAKPSGPDRPVGAARTFGTTGGEARITGGYGGGERGPTKSTGGGCFYRGHPP